MGHVKKNEQGQRQETVTGNVAGILDLDQGGGATNAKQPWLVMSQGYCIEVWGAEGVDLG